MTRKAPAPTEQTAAEPHGDIRIAHRFEESGASWVVYDKHPTKTPHQHYIESCNGMVPPCRVTINCPGMKAKGGELQTFLPGWGPSPRPIIGAVVVDPTPELLQAAGQTYAGYKPVMRYYRAEWLSKA